MAGSRSRRGAQPLQPALIGSSGMLYSETIRHAGSSRGRNEQDLAQGIILRARRPGIDPDQYLSILDLLDGTFAKLATKPAFHNLGSLSFAELDLQSRAFAAFLQGTAGMVRASAWRSCRNLLQYRWSSSASRAGMTVVSNQSRLFLPPRELEHQLKDSARVIVIVELRADPAAGIGQDAGRHVITTQIGDMLPAPKRWLVNS